PMAEGQPQPQEQGEGGRRKRRRRRGRGRGRGGAGEGQQPPHHEGEQPAPQLPRDDHEWGGPPPSPVAHENGQVAQPPQRSIPEQAEVAPADRQPRQEGGAPEGEQRQGGRRRRRRGRGGRGGEGKGQPQA